MSLLNAIPGILTLELTSADPEEAFGLLTASGIGLSGIRKKTELTFQCRILKKDHSQLTAICKNQGYSVKVLSRSGSYWAVKKLLLRPALIAGLLLLLLTALSLPTRILFVQVKGNHNIPANKILSCAQDCGISFFASRKAVRSEKVKNALLYHMPELEWVGVNTAGCVATISVRERAEENHQSNSKVVSSIVAVRDGFLLSVTVTSGNPLCQPGQYVTAGQLLVSGYTDCGIFIQATASEADILAQTSRQLEAVRPVKPFVRKNQTGSRRKYSLLLGKKRINLWKGSGIWDTTCGRIYEEKYVTLPGGFQLPLALCIEEYVFYDTQPVSEGKDAQTSLSTFAKTYLRHQMTAGTVLSREEAFSRTDETLRLTGNYTCQEMIGRIQQEQIGEHYG